VAAAAAAAASSFTRPPSYRRLTGQKPAVSKPHLSVNCTFLWLLIKSLAWEYKLEPESRGEIWT